MKKSIILLTLMLTAFNLMAAGTCNTNSCTAKLTQLFIHQDTKIYLKVDADMTVLDCVAPAGGGIELTEANPRYNELYSALLSAYMSDATIRVRSAVRTDPGSDTGQICELKYVILNKAY